jgi:hypothetical protein
VRPKLKLLLAVLILGYAVLEFMSTGFYQSRQHSDTIAHDLPLKFAHIDHAKEKCVDCHHNYQDDTGQGLCLDCHYRDPELSYLMEQQFHDLCRGCHEDKRLDGDKSGPLRICGVCHQQVFLP